MHLECLVAFLVVCSLPPEVLDIGQPGGGRCKMLQTQFDLYCNWYTCIMLVQYILDLHHYYNLASGTHRRDVSTRMDFVAVPVVALPLTCVCLC